MKHIAIKSIAVLFAAFILACKPTDRIQVTPVSSLPDDNVVQRIYYSLPRTVLKISVGYDKTVTVPGPYADYAEKYLGITDIIRKPSVRYHINGAWVSSSLESDPSRAYAINVLKGTFDPGALTALADQGRVFDGGQVDGSFLILPYGEDEEPPLPAFTDLTIQGNYTTKEETMYKTIVSDSGYVRVPILRTQIEQKTPEKKAEEAAAFITKLRKRRFKLVSGQYDVFPEGIAMAEAIRELDKTEEEYLSLFIGRQYRTEFTREFWFIPSGTEGSDKKVLAGFSSQGGFQPSGDEPVSDLVIRINTPGSAYPALQTEGYEEDPLFNQLFYRIPVMTEVEVILGERSLCQERMLIEQSGPLVSVPIQ